MKATDQRETDFSFSTEYEFNQTMYICKINTVNKKVLVVEVEDIKTGDRWRGEFSASSIEAVTGKTGNFKKFSIFVKMLYHSFTQKTPTVYVELLTRNRLELLFRKNVSTTSSNKSRNFGKSSNQRYLILTYNVEFDRVHYPLPLAYQKPSVERLQKTIFDLRGQMQQMSTSTRPVVMEKGGGNESEFLRLKRQNERIKRERDTAVMELNALKDQSSKEIQTLNREIELLGTEMESSDVEMKQLRKQFRSPKEADENRILKKRIKDVLGKLKRKDALVSRKNREIEALKSEIKGLKGKNKRLTLEKSRLGKRVGGRTARKKPFKRFNPTEWDKKRRGRSSSTGRRSSLPERMRSRSRGRSRSRSRSKTRKSRSRSRKSRSRSRNSRSSSKKRSSSRRSRSNSRSKSKRRASSRHSSRESSVERKIEEFREKRKGKIKPLDTEELKKRLMELRKKHKSHRKQIRFLRSSTEHVYSSDSDHE